MESEIKNCFESGTPRDMFGHITSDDIGIDSRDFVIKNRLVIWISCEFHISRTNSKIQNLPIVKFYGIIGVTFCVFALMGFAIGFGEFSLTL